MFLFIVSLSLITSTSTPFKYILCSYLSELGTEFSTQRVDLNTSYVLIYPIFVRSSVLTLFDLNTSYVLIYPMPKFVVMPKFVDLNTSYVLIYLKSTNGKKIIKIFKYILCSYLSNQKQAPAGVLFYLNTSYVLIYRSHLFRFLSPS
mgnify:CR=1 FL=1